MRKVELRPLSDLKPGYAQLVMIGGTPPSEGLSVDIQRNQDEHFLQADGKWGSHSFKFTLPTLQTNADGHSTAVVDEQIVDPLIENPHATNMVRFYAADGTELGRARLKLARDLMPSGASGSTPSLAAGAALHSPAAPEPEPEPDPIPVEPSPAEVTTPAPEAPQTAKKGNKRWLWIVLAIVLLALLAAAAWFGLAMRNAPSDAASEAEQEESQPEQPLEEEPAAPEPEPEPEPEAEIAPVGEEGPAEGIAAPCSLQRMTEQGELEFIQSCTSAGIDSDVMLSVIDDALANERCGIARRLYAHEALNGDIDAALGYARQFDPEQHASSTCFPEADAETAIFWYETAQGIDATNPEANQRLEELQP